MIAELDRVVLTVEIPEKELAIGDIGTVVHVFPEQAGCIVEFVTLRGETVAVVPLSNDAVRPIGDDEMASARALHTTA